MKFIIVALALFASMAFSQETYFGSQNAVHWNMSGRINMAKGEDIPAKATVDLSSVAGNLVHITGASTITSFGTPSQAGIQRTVIFDGASLLVHNASTLVIPGASTILTVAGDSAQVVSDSLTKWIVLRYQRGAAVITSP